MNKMVAFGMKSTDKEYAAVLDYLVKHSRPRMCRA